MSQYIWHTTDTGYGNRSYRGDISNYIAELIKTWLPDLLNGHRHQLFPNDDNYAIRCEWHNGKAAAFIIERLSSTMQPTELIRFAICRHSRKKAAAWAFANGTGEPPQVPFIATHIIQDNVEPPDLERMDTITEFQQCLAWVWLEQAA